MKISELAALPADAYLNPATFRTAYDMEALAEKQYAEGLRIATEFHEVHIAVNSVWSACSRTDNIRASCQSYETIGYHAGTADLLRGFLAGTARIVVHRYQGDELTRTVIKEATPRAIVLVKAGEARLWKQNGTIEDIAAAAGYAEEFGYSMRLYPATEQDPIGKAARDV